MPHRMTELSPVPATGEGLSSYVDKWMDRWVDRPVLRDTEERGRNQNSSQMRPELKENQ